MAAITISRQMGSLGEEVAFVLSGKLSYQIINREIINQAALRARKPEIALASIDDLGLIGLRLDAKSRQIYHRAVSEIMIEIANRGNAIIIGRAGQIILKDHPLCFHVMVIAPAKLRAERIANVQKISIDNGMAQIKASDQSRRRYLRRYYGIAWDDPTLYDMILNTARLSPDQAACTIIQAFEQGKWGSI